MIPGTMGTSMPAAADRSRSATQSAAENNIWLIAKEAPALTFSAK